MPKLEINTEDKNDGKLFDNVLNIKLFNQPEKRYLRLLKKEQKYDLPLTKQENIIINAAR